MNVLVVGDWYTHCGVCGKGADPDEAEHRTVLPGLTRTRDVGCGAVWTHVARAMDSKGSLRRVREMRPDLVCLATPVDHRRREVAS